MDNYTPKSRFALFLTRIKRKLLAHVFVARIVLVVFGVSLLIGLIVLFRGPLSAVFSRVFFFPKMASVFLFGSPSSLPQKEGRTNILLLGAGGAGHEAPELTDTILLVSVDHKTKSPVFLSLPRDIWIPSLRAKLNTTYYYGNQKRPGGGLILAKASVSEILDQPVHYGTVLNFAGFIKLVDLLGGIEIEVERSLDDYKYPIPGKENDLCGGDPEFRCRYEHVHFGRGKQVILGERALKFVRSRNAEGDEGTDFARANRQQKVILAIKQKLLLPTVLLNPAKIGGVWQIINESLETDIPQDKLPIIARLVLKIKKETIKNVVLDGGTTGDAQTGFLINPPISPKYDNQWVLVPRDGTWREIRVWVTDLLR